MTEERSKRAVALKNIVFVKINSKIRLNKIYQKPSHPLTNQKKKYLLHLTKANYIKTSQMKTNKLTTNLY